MITLRYKFPTKQVYEEVFAPFLMDGVLEKNGGHTSPITYEGMTLVCIGIIHRIVSQTEEEIITESLEGYHADLYCSEVQAETWRNEYVLESEPEHPVHLFERV